MLMLRRLVCLAAAVLALSATAAFAASAPPKPCTVLSAKNPSVASLRNSSRSLVQSLAGGNRLGAALAAVQAQAAFTAIRSDLQAALADPAVKRQATTVTASLGAVLAEVRHVLVLAVTGDRAGARAALAGPLTTKLDAAVVQLDSLAAASGCGAARR
jgi:hypothetical protein